MNPDIELLITAFAYPFSSLNEAFYLRKRDLKVIGVHILDHALFSEFPAEYNSGLTKEEEADIKEVIIAIDKNHDTHIPIPRLTKEERFEIMEQFIKLVPTFKRRIEMNYRNLVDSTKEYGVQFFRKGIIQGVEMDYLTNGIDNDTVSYEWTEFYRNKIRIKALAWLDEQKKQ